MMTDKDLEILAMQQNAIDNDEIDVQVNVPVCVTIKIKAKDADAMYFDQLRTIVDGVLDRCGVNGGFVDADTDVAVKYEVDKAWDFLPEDAMEIMLGYEGLFPKREDSDGN